MRVGTVKEIKNHEYRVGLTPESARELVVHGHEVWVETGAGSGIGASDRDYEAAGAVIKGDAAAIFADCEMVVKVKEPQAAERAMLRAGQVLYTYLHLAPDPEQLGQRLLQITQNLPDALRSGGNGLADVFATPEQRAEIAKVTAIMSLLEGHADVVMDDVGPLIVPSVEEIRAKFQQRRHDLTGLDKILRRLLGLEAKMRQYRDGARFVRAVTATVGTDGFNAVWTSPETLPLPAEIENPATWVQRVHG